MSHGHKDLVVWQKSMDLVVLVYETTERFPKEETYGLTSQMRRSAVSIPCNIAEGKRRKTDNEFRHFLRVAFGSAAELETQLEISLRLHYIDISIFDSVTVILDEVMKMLNKMSADQSMFIGYQLRATGYKL